MERKISPLFLQKTFEDYVKEKRSAVIGMIERPYTAPIMRRIRIAPFSLIWILAKEQAPNPRRGVRGVNKRSVEMIVSIGFGAIGVMVLFLVLISMQGEIVKMRLDLKALEMEVKSLKGSSKS